LTAAPKNATPRWRCIGLRQGYFLFVGTLQPRKNVERLLEAYLALPPVLRSARQLVIVGRRAGAAKNWSSASRMRSSAARTWSGSTS
jgi:alpha-1,3-rhamnosyl/mannosyltransferase